MVVTATKLRETLASEVGARLREARERAELSRHQLAMRSGIPERTIERIEWGRSLADPETLEVLAPALGVSAHYLATGL